MMSGYFAHSRRHSATGHHSHVLAAVLSRHGFGTGSLCADSGGISRCAHQPHGIPAAAGPVDATDGNGGESRSTAFSAAPNFAFELAARKISDDDMAGLDLGGHARPSSAVASGYNPATLQALQRPVRPLQFSGTVLRPSYGLAEATVYVATSEAGKPPRNRRFRRPTNCPPAKRSGAQAESSTPLISYEVPQSPTVRIVDPDTCTECPEGAVGEIWVHGDNVAVGYWNKPEETERTFGGRLVAASAGTPEGPWLKNRRLGLHFRRRAVHHRPHQGSADRSRAQPLSRRHRGDDPGDHPGPMRGDSGSDDGGGREAGHHHRSQKARRSNEDVMEQAGHGQA